LPKHPVLRGLEPQEIRAQATADGHMVVVTDDVLRVGSTERMALEVAIDNLRRIQFDIERDRPATLVIVPLSPNDEPQVVVVQPQEYASVAEALVFIGQRMVEVQRRETSKE
jgi:hypothetical protein